MSWREDGVAHWAGMIGYFVDQGYSREEIVAVCDLDARRSGMRMRLQPRSGDLLDWENLHDRRMIEALIAELTGSPSTAGHDPWWTPRRIEVAEDYRKAVRWLNRNGRASVAAAARQAGVDRGTLAGWIKAGRLEPPEDVSQR